MLLFSNQIPKWLSSTLPTSLLFFYLLSTLQLLLVTAKSMFLGLSLLIPSPTQHLSSSLIWLSLMRTTLRGSNIAIEKACHFPLHRGSVNFCLSVPSGHCSWEEDSSFSSWPPPTIHSGVQVQVMGLPRPFSPEQLKLLGQSLALKPMHLVHYKLLCSCRGKPKRSADLLCVPVFSPGG